MGMPDMARKWNREMVLALPDDGNRYELFDGELLVTPSPAGLHQVAIAALVRRLLPFVTEQRLGWLMTAPADLNLGGGQLSQPTCSSCPTSLRAGSGAAFRIPF
jgi:hypothetical protein